MRINLILLTLALTSILLLTVLLDRLQKPVVSIATDHPSATLPSEMMAPDFAFTTLDRKKMKLSALRGKPVILHFWATWCPPCVVELPSLLKTAQTFNAKISVVIVSLDLQESSLKKFMAKNPASSSNVYQVWDERKNISQDLFQTYNLPETIIIDAKGEMIRKIPGNADWQSKETLAYPKGLSK